MRRKRSKNPHWILSAKFFKRWFGYKNLPKRTKINRHLYQTRFSIKKVNLKKLIKLLRKNTSKSCRFLDLRSLKIIVMKFWYLLSWRLKKILRNCIIIVEKYRILTRTKISCTILWRSMRLKYLDFAKITISLVKNYLKISICSQTPTIKSLFSTWKL